jgi:hypothetical protein
MKNMRINTTLHRHCGRGPDHRPRFGLELNGSDTKDDPFLITNESTYDSGDYEITFSDTHNYCIFNKINLRSLNLKNSANITISDTNVLSIELENCNNILIKNSNIEGRLQLSKVREIRISKCKVRKLFAISGDQILFSNSSIMKISRKSKANILIQEE